MKRLFGILTVAVVLATGSLTYAGALHGPQSKMTTVDAHGSDSYEITFIGGEYGQVRIHSYGLTFIKAGVFDEQGNLLAVDTDRTGDIVLTFYASQTGRYLIVVLNEAPVANPYFISTN